MGWYDEWATPEHAVVFDGRAAVGDRGLVRWFTAFNDVQLLEEIMHTVPVELLLEVGCATGDFFRFLRRRYPGVRYRGVDVSPTAIAVATRRYPEASFGVVDADTWAANLGLDRRPDVVFSKDVVHHQVDPRKFLTDLIRTPTRALVFRCRTKDAGETEWCPELSCQYHYHGWVPYIIINTDELIVHIRQLAPACELIVHKQRVVLGGRNGRYLPKDCYVPAGGTAETAVAVILETRQPGRVHVEDRPERYPEPVVVRATRGVARLCRVLSRVAGADGR